MDAAAILRTLPESDVYERDEALLRLARAGELVFEMRRVAVNERLSIQVTRDLVKWGSPGDAVRLGTTAYTQQRIADENDGVLLTPKLCDAVAAAAYLEGGLVGLAVQKINSLTSGYVQHSDDIDAALPLDWDGLVDGPKHWTVSADVWRKRGFATNYGGTYAVGQRAPAPLVPSVSNPRLLVIQGPYEAHDTGKDVDGDGYADSGHGDYSQLMRWAARRAWLDGSEIDLRDAYMGKLGKDVAAMVSHEGALPDYRLPGVPLVFSEDRPKPKDTPVPRVTRPGERGADVKTWQIYLLSSGLSLPVYGADGDHGTETEVATVEWFRIRGLEPLDRPAVITGARRQAEEIEEDDRPTVPDEAPAVIAVADGIELPEISFLQARYFRPGRRLGDWSNVFIHVGQLAELDVTAERLASYCHTMPDGRIASWHFAADCNSITQSVRVSDTAFAARAGNDLGVHIELGGYVGQGVSGWADEYSTKMLELAARLTGRLCAELGIPVLKRDAYQVLDRMPGIAGHDDISAACVLARRQNRREFPWWDGSSGRWRATNHSDPGPTFPWRSFIDRTREVEALARAAGPERKLPWA